TGKGHKQATTISDISPVIFGGGYAFRPGYSVRTGHYATVVSRPAHSHKQAIAVGNRTPIIVGSRRTRGPVYPVLAGHHAIGPDAIRTHRYKHPTAVRYTVPIDFGGRSRGCST